MKCRPSSIPQASTGPKVFQPSPMNTSATVAPPPIAAYAIQWRGHQAPRLATSRRNRVPSPSSGERISAVSPVHFRGGGGGISG